MDSQLALAAAPLVTLGTLLFLFTLLDLVHRPAAQVVGPKLAWSFALLILALGPIAYLWFGRKDGHASDR